MNRHSSSETVKLVPDASSIFVFDLTASAAQIAETGRSAISAGEAVGSKTKIEEASGTSFIEGVLG